MTIFYNIFKKITNNLLEIIFPRFCINCQKEGLYLCDNCSLFLCEVSLICPVCQKNSYYGKACLKCRNNQQMQGLVSFWQHEGVIKKTINNVKNKGTFHILEEITERIILLIEKQQERFSCFFDFINNKNTYITFVPISSEKEKERGFNQSEIIANYISKIFNKKKVTLFKIKDNEIIFIPPENKINRVVIVDDFWISGITMKKYNEILINNNIKEVWGFTICRI